MSTIESKHKILFTELQVLAGIQNVAAEISEHFSGKEIVLVGILKGAYFFLAHLATAIEKIGLVASCRIEFMKVSSYGDGQTQGTIRIEHDLPYPISGANVILVDDIADTRRTLHAIVALLQLKAPAALEVAVLFNKPEAAKCDLALNYVALGREHAGWIYGCGMDTQEGRHRALPFIAVADASGNPQPS